MSRGRSPIILAGHSHAYALGLPAVPTDADPSVVPLPVAHEQVFGVTGGWPRSPAYWDRVAAEAGRMGVAAIVWQGSQHLSTFLFRPEIPFDFVSSAEPWRPVEENAEIIPEAVVRDYYRPTIEDLEPVLRRIVAQGGRAIVVGTPPPKGDDEILRRLLLAEPFFLEQGRALNLDPCSAVLTSRWLRLKLWNVVQDLMSAAAADAGAMFLPVPAELKDGDGFLRAEFYEHDVGHADAAYGRAMLARIVEHARSASQAA